MAITWKEVSSKPEFKSLSADDQEATRDLYFRDVVAPQVDTDQLEATRAAFDADTTPTTWGRVKDAVESTVAPVSGLINAAVDAMPAPAGYAPAPDQSIADQAVNVRPMASGITFGKDGLSTENDRGLSMRIAGLPPQSSGIAGQPATAGQQAAAESRRKAQGMADMSRQLASDKLRTPEEMVRDRPDLLNEQERIAAEKRGAKSMPGAMQYAADFYPDAAKDLMSGFAGLSTAAGQAEKFAGLEKMGQAIIDEGNSAQKYWASLKSAYGKDAAEKKVIGSGDFSSFGNAINTLASGNWSAGDANASTILSHALQSAPGMLAMGGVGKLASTAMIKTGALDWGASLLSRTLGVSAPAAQKAVEFVADGVAFGGAEGVFSGLQNAAQTGSEIRAMTFDKLMASDNFIKHLAEQNHALPEAERMNIARNAAADDAEAYVFKNTLVTTGGIAALTGGGIFGIANRGAGTAAGRAVKGIATEGIAQEFPQSMLEQLHQNKAVQKYADPTQDASEGVFEGGVVGGLVGGVMGVGGAISPNKAAPAQDTPPPAAAAPGSLASAAIIAVKQGITPVSVPPGASRTEQPESDAVQAPELVDDTVTAQHPGTAATSPGEQVAPPNTEPGTPLQESAPAPVTSLEAIDGADISGASRNTQSDNSYARTTGDVVQPSARAGGRNADAVGRVDAVGNGMAAADAQQSSGAAREAARPVARPEGAALAPQEQRDDLNVLKAYKSKASARMAADNLTKSTGETHEVIPHPAEAGSFAILKAATPTSTPSTTPNNSAAQPKSTAYIPKAIDTLDAAKRNAEMLARQGFGESDVIPHPTETGKFAVVPKGSAPEQAATIAGVAPEIKVAADSAKKSGLTSFSKRVAITDERMANESHRNALVEMQSEFGWAERGGKLVRGQDGEAASRTKWLPLDERGLWQGRPDANVSEVEARQFVGDALSSRPLPAKGHRFVKYLLDVSVEREKQIAALESEVQNIENSLTEDEYAALDALMIDAEALLGHDVAQKISDRYANIPDLSGVRAWYDALTFAYKNDIEHARLKNEQGNGTTQQADAGVAQESDRPGSAEAGNQGSPQALSLTSPTEEGLRQQAAVQAAQKAATRAEDAQAKKDQEAKDKADLEARTTSHAANPDNFQFGESSKDAAKPMGDIFSQPAAKHENATAPEHVSNAEDQGVTVSELKRIAQIFRDAVDRGKDNVVTHIFDAPAKKDIVRLQDKVRVFVAEKGWMTAAEAKAEIAKWKENARSQYANSDVRSANNNKIVLSLFDKSGEWSKPWEEAGYQVYRFDIQNDPDMGDVNNFSAGFFNDWFSDFDGLDIYAVLAACPCTDFAVSGARHFAAKDEDGRTVSSVKLVKQTMNVIEHFKPAIWALENPVGRIESLTGLPQWRLSFDPNHIGETYTKKTLIWGRYNADLPIAPMEPTEGSKMHTKYGGKSMATKNARSVTPEGFAYSFFQANNAHDNPVLAVAGKYDRLDKNIIGKAIAAGVTPEQIDEAVEDFYYMDLDDEAANKAITKLLGKAVMNMGDKPAAKPSKKHAGNALESALSEYEDTGEIGTVDELADRIESMIGEDTAPDSLTEAIKHYRDDQEYDRELSGRGDMDAAETKLIAAIRAAANSKPVPAPADNIIAVSEIPKSLKIELRKEVGGKTKKKLVDAKKAMLAANQRVEKLEALMRCMG